ncbi:MAG: rhodanese-related sulfurtransferase [Buchnera aphidicola (Nurudea yanoniella)]
MIVLHNLISNKELKDKMLFDKVSRITISFYKYFFIHDPKKIRDDWYVRLRKFNVLGRIYIAQEGINAQISVPIDFYQDVKKFICSYSDSLRDLFINKSLDNKKSFWVLRMKVKDTILSDHLCKNSYDLKYIGRYLDAIDVNMMLTEKDVIFLDIRNHYEYKIGRFEKAVNVPVNTFKEQLQEVVKLLADEKDKKIVLYCTGGIRCEKASSWMIYNNFKNVYQIRGGIIGYVNNAQKNHLPIFFKGKNFVFDARMSEKVSDDILSKCSQCDEYCDSYKNCYNNSCHKLFIQCMKCSEIFKNCCSEHCIFLNNLK